VTTCSQSQFGRTHHLRRCGAAQVGAASVLSVVVRWGPVRTAVNGTLVARPPRDDPGIRLRRWFHPDPTVRRVFGDPRLVGKSPEGSRQPGRGLEPSLNAAQPWWRSLTSSARGWAPPGHHMPRWQAVEDRATGRTNLWVMSHLSTIPLGCSPVQNEPIYRCLATYPQAAVPLCSSPCRLVS
jgi:hypothetical protein